MNAWSSMLRDLVADLLTHVGSQIVL